MGGKAWRMIESKRAVFREEERCCREKEATSISMSQW